VRDSYNMRQLKSTYRDFHRMFRQAVTVREIAEPLISFERNQPAPRMQAFMETNKLFRIIFGLLKMVSVGTQEDLINEIRKQF